MTIQAQILSLINAERQKVGACALSARDDIAQASALRAKEASVLWSHTRPNGTQYFTANDSIYGENLSRGYKTASEIVRAWMRSDTHREVMLDKRYKGASVGVYSHGEPFVSLELTL